jgi:hypothetical protein
VIPIIGVAVPDEVSTADVAALLEACDQVFVKGDCADARDPSDGSEPELRANIDWLGPNQARVTILRKRDDASDSEEVSFVEQDEMTERYRALGFAIGSLGSAFVGPEPESPPEPPPTLAAPEAEPIRTPDPPDPIPERPAEQSPPLDEALTRFHVELGALGGNGLAKPRLGGELGVWIPVVGRWASRWAGNLTTQEATSDGVSANFVAASAGFGPRLLAGDTVIAIIAGVQLQQMSVSLGEAELGRALPATGPFLAIHGRLLDRRFAPFLSVRAGTLPTTPVVVEELDAEGNPTSNTLLVTHGPLQLDVALGLSLAF